jgi:hypothetical protein
MKLAIERVIPEQYNRPRIMEAFRAIQDLVNGLAEGRIGAKYNARTSAPTTGSYARGDKIDNSEPSELGAVNSKYVIVGWICVSSGVPGTWKERRTLTGN